MPCGRMSMASRSRSCDFARLRDRGLGFRARALDVADLCGRARSSGERRGSALPGRPKTRALGAGFRFLCLLAGAAALTVSNSHSAPALLGQVSEKMVSSCRRTSLDEERSQNQPGSGRPFERRMRARRPTRGCTTTCAGRNMAPRNDKSLSLDDGCMTRAGNAQRKRRLYFVRTNFDQHPRGLSRS